MRATRPSWDTCTCTSSSLTGNSGHPTRVRHSSRKSSATHSYHCVQYFPLSKQWYGCQCLRFLTFADVDAHGGCTDTERESALKADSGRKIPCRTGDSNPRQYCAWIFNRTLYPLSYHPLPFEEGSRSEQCGRSYQPHSPTTTARELRAPGTPQGGFTLL